MTVMNTGSKEPMVFASKGLLAKVIPEMLEYTANTHQQGCSSDKRQNAVNMNFQTGSNGKGVVPWV